MSWAALAAAALVDGDAQGAELAAERAVRHAPSFHAWVILGVARARNKDFSEAIPCFLSALQLRPGDVATWTDLGEAYLSALDFDKASQALEQAMRLDPLAAHPADRRARAIVARTLMRLDT